MEFHSSQLQMATYSMTTLIRWPVNKVPMMTVLLFSPLYFPDGGHVLKLQQLNIRLTCAQNTMHHGMDTKSNLTDVYSLRHTN